MQMFSCRYFCRAVALGALFGAMIFTSSARAENGNSLLERIRFAERAMPGTRLFVTDNGNWGGVTVGTTHQDNPDYQAEKTIEIPPGALRGMTLAKLRVFMAVQDFSQGGDPTKLANGLDENFVLDVNGNAHIFPTNAGFPGKNPQTQIMTWDWHDFLIPVSQLKEGRNTFVFRKAPAAKNDDFLYIGIDNTARHGLSRSTVDGGKTWRSEELNMVPGTRGEYMVRLMLLAGDAVQRASWTPAKTDDTFGLFDYAALEKSDALSTQNASTQNVLRLELDTSKIDRSGPMQLRVYYRGEDPQLRLYEEPPAVFGRRRDAAPSSFAVPTPRRENGALIFDFSANAPRLTVMELAHGSATQIVGAELSYRPEPLSSEYTGELSNPAPRVLKARFSRKKIAPRATLSPANFSLQNGAMRADFSTKNGLRLTSLFMEELGKNVLAHPEKTRLFLVEIGGKRYGAEDWKVEKVTPLSTQGVAVQLALPQEKLRAQLTLKAQASALRMALNITNAGREKQSWKTAFPQIGGLQLSPSSEGDNYLFPLYGGAIGALPANLRTAYGENSAWYQLMDVFSPSGGAGLGLRADDASGLYKAPALRKGENASQEVVTIGDDMAPELVWKNSLEAAPGIAMTFEYLGRTREAGQGFAPPDAVLFAHSGDWKNAMREYSDWAYKTWKWRAPAKKFRDAWNISAVGWTSDALFKNGKWRTDYAEKASPIAHADIYELWGWWTWSDEGPWGAPVRPAGAMRAALGDPHSPETAMMDSILVPDPADGVVRNTMVRGDYDYNTRWGGLPAFRANVEAIKKMGKQVMLYTVPAIADANTKLGKEFGKKYGVINPRRAASDRTKLTPEGYVGTFMAYNIDPDNEWYPKFLADQMSRLIRDTKADGIRLDVYGFGGYANDNTQFKRKFAEPGHNAYLQATASAAKQMRAAMDKENPQSTLTTESPGYDYLMAQLDGSLAYESWWQAGSVTPLRPVPLNAARFYFPTFKFFDIDNWDANNRVPGSSSFQLWNGSAVFGPLYAPREYSMMRENGDAFNDLKPEPLVETLREKIYANRFSAGAKSLTTIINSENFTVSAPLLRVLSDANTHYFDVRHSREVTPQNGAIHLRLRPREVAVIAKLPRLLQAQKTANGWTASLRAGAKKPAENYRVALCDADGKQLASASFSGAATTLQLPAGVSTQPVCLKLFEGLYLRDAVEIAP